MLTNERDIKDFYDMLLDTGELKVMFSEFNFKGDWKKDKKKFIEAHLANLEAMENVWNLDVFLDDEDYQ